jgi:hypothetical protein
VIPKNNVISVTDLYTGLRVEWCKAWARTRRWTEEVRLLKDEMRRTPLSLHHNASWWMEHRYPEGFEDEHAEGAAAYATRQATLHTDIATAFETLWAPLRDLEVVEELEPALATPNPASDDDIDEHDVDDGNDGIHGEDGGEEDQNAEEEEEGSTGEVSGEEEEDL